MWPISGSRRLFYLVNLSIFFLLTGVSVYAQTFTVVHSFTGGSDGANPYSGLVMDQGGNLYGTASAGSLGYGNVYRLVSKNSAWIVQALYGFQGAAHNHDGARPMARITLRNGIVYGTTQAGGMSGCANNAGCGTIFKLRPPLSVCQTVFCAWTQTVLYRFNGNADGGNPVGDLTFDQGGNLYGATSGGGSAGCHYQPNDACGVVYLLNSAGSQSVLYQMPAGSGGTYPEAGVSFDTSGNLLGTTSAGGTSNLGTIFRLTHSGGNWTPSSVYQFQSGAGGQLPWAGLVGDSSGNFFGATTAGGANGGGTVYQLSPSGGGWTYSSIYTFAAGGGPVSNLTIDSSGNLYGTTPGGGAFGHGTVFKLTHSGSAWIYASLHDFTGGSDGAQPSGSVVLDANGSVYGTAYGGGSSNCPGGCGVAWSVSQGLAITTTSLPAGAVGQQYQAQLAASGGQPPYTWSLTSGSLPTGLNLSTSGLISGIPSGQGAFTFTVQVRDQLSNRAGKNFSITISSSNLAITTTQLPSGTQGTFYNTALSASGGTPPYSWSIVSGALPAGLSLVSSTGVIQGTPTTPGLSTFTVQVRDASSNTARAPLQITIAPRVSDAILNGHYVIALNGFKSSSPFIMVAAFTADGNGNITSGKLDVNYGQGEPNDSSHCRGNRNCPIAETIQSPGSGYVLSGGNGLGTLTLATIDNSGSPHTYQFTISVSAGACTADPSLSSCGRIIERDPANPQTYGSGVLKVADPQYFSTDAFFPGNFALLANGIDPGGKRYAAIGAIATNPITEVDIDCNGNGWGLEYCPLDFNDNGVSGSNPYHGSFAADLDPTTGRGNFVNIGFPNDPNGYCTGAGTTPSCGFAYYIVNRQEMILISSNPLSKPANMALWTLFRQPSAAHWGLTSLNGVSAVELTGATSANAADVSAGLFSANGAGTTTMNSDENSGGTTSRRSSNGTYSIDATGQKTGKVLLSGLSQFGSNGAEIYLYNTNQGYVLVKDANVTSGVMEPQAGSPYSNASISGNIVGGTVWPAATGVTNSATSLFADGAGNISAAQYTSGSGGPGGPNNLTLTYQIDTTGRTVVLQNGNPFGVLYVVGPDKFVLVPSGSAPALNVFFSGQPD